MRSAHAQFLGILVACLALAFSAGCSASSERVTTKERVTAAAGPCASAPSQRTGRDLPYASSSPYQTLDLFLPQEGNGPFPVIVYVHGGSYIEGDKSQLVPGLTELANERGYAVVSVNYRLLQEAPFPAQAEDVQAALQWLRANASAYALDTDRIALWGLSAGGHLAALAGTAEGATVLDDPALGGPSEPERVAAVVDWYGPADFAALMPYIQSQHEATGESESRLEYMEQILSESPAMLASADPAAHADEDDPPIRIEHGTDDTVVPVDQSIGLAARLRERMGAQKVTLVIEPGEGHGTDVFRSEAKVREVLDWLDGVLR